MNIKHMFMALQYPKAQSKKKHHWTNTAAMYSSSWEKGARLQITNSLEHLQ